MRKILLWCSSLLAFTTWTWPFLLLPLKSLSPPNEISYQRVEEPFDCTDAFSLVFPTDTRKDVVQETVGTSCTKRTFPLVASGEHTQQLNSQARNKNMNKKHIREMLVLLN